MQREQQQQPPRVGPGKGHTDTMPASEIAESEVAMLQSGLDKLKQQEQRFSAALAALATNPAFRSDEKEATVFVKAMRQESGE